MCLLSVCLYSTQKRDLRHNATNPTRWGTPHMISSFSVSFAQLSITERVCRLEQYRERSTGHASSGIGKLASKTVQVPNSCIDSEKNRPKLGTQINEFLRAKHRVNKGGRDQRFTDFVFRFIQLSERIRSLSYCAGVQMLGVNDGQGK